MITEIDGDLHELEKVPLMSLNRKKPYQKYLPQNER